MAVHEPHPGRRSRSVSFDDGKRRVIASELDPEVDPAKLKTVVGRPPTPRPSRTDVSVTTPEENGESSRPPSAASRTSPPAHKDDPALNPELLTMRLTLECADEAAKERAADESGPASRRRRRHERGRPGRRQAVVRRRADQRGRWQLRVAREEGSRHRGRPPSSSSPGDFTGVSQLVGTSGSPSSIGDQLSIYSTRPFVLSAAAQNGDTEEQDHRQTYQPVVKLNDTFFGISTSWTGSDGGHSAVLWTQDSLSLRSGG
ncbi:hypothetical protein MTO96_012539 [Rhipicephalus appendiculatus]